MRVTLLGDKVAQNSYKLLVSKLDYLQLDKQTNVNSFYTMMTSRESTIDRLVIFEDILKTQDDKTKMKALSTFMSTNHSETRIVTISINENKAEFFSSIFDTLVCANVNVSKLTADMLTEFVTAEIDTIKEKFGYDKETEKDRMEVLSENIETQKDVKKEEKPTKKSIFSGLFGKKKSQSKTKPQTQNKQNEQNEQGFSDTGTIEESPPDVQPSTITPDVGDTTDVVGAVTGEVLKQGVASQVPPVVEPPTQKRRGGKKKGGFFSRKNKNVEPQEEPQESNVSNDNILDENGQEIVQEIDFITGMQSVKQEQAIEEVLLDDEPTPTVISEESTKEPKGLSKVEQDMYDERHKEKETLEEVVDIPKNDVNPFDVLKGVSGDNETPKNNELLDKFINIIEKPKENPVEIPKEVVKKPDKLTIDKIADYERMTEEEEKLAQNQQGYEEEENSVTEQEEEDFDEDEDDTLILPTKTTIQNEKNHQQDKEESKIIEQNVQEDEKELEKPKVEKERRYVEKRVIDIEPTPKKVLPVQPKPVTPTTNIDLPINPIKSDTSLSNIDISSLPTNVTPKIEIPVKKGVKVEKRVYDIPKKPKKVEMVDNRKTLDVELAKQELNRGIEELYAKLDTIENTDGVKEVETKLISIDTSNLPNLSNIIPVKDLIKPLTTGVNAGLSIVGSLEKYKRDLEMGTVESVGTTTENMLEVVNALADKINKEKKVELIKVKVPNVVIQKKTKNEEKQIKSVKVENMSNMIENHEGNKNKVKVVKEVVEKIVEVPVEKVIEVEKPVEYVVERVITQDGKQKHYFNNTRIVIFTGERKTGVTSLSLLTSRYYAKNSKTLFVDFDLKRRGSLLSLGLENIAEAEDEIQNGLNNIRSENTLKHLVYRQTDQSYDSLINLYGEDVSEEQVLKVQQILLSQRDYGTIVIDCPLENIPLLQLVLKHAEILICVETGVDNLITTIMEISSFDNIENFDTTVFYNNSSYIVPRSNDAQDFEDSMEYISEVFDTSEEKFDWAKLTLRGTSKDIKRVLDSI